MSLLSAFANAASWVFGTGAVEDDNTAEYRQQNSQQQPSDEWSDITDPPATDLADALGGPQTDIDNNADANVSAVAKGELWRYEPKRENFKLVLRDITAMIIDEKSENFKAAFGLRKKNGDFLLNTDISSDLNFQYNQEHHSMVFLIENQVKQKHDILSFTFTNAQEEREFKLLLSIKLFESNRGESFAKVVQAQQPAQEDMEWVQGCLETAPTGKDDHMETDDLELDDDVVMQDFSQMTLDAGRGARDDSDRDEQDYPSDEEEERKQNKWAQAASGPVEVPHQSALDPINSSPFSPDKKPPGQTNRSITSSKQFNRTYVVRKHPKESVLGYFKHNDDNELEYQGKIRFQNSKGKDLTPQKVMQQKSDRQMLVLGRENPHLLSVMDIEQGKVIEEWEATEGGLGVVNDITPITKHEQLNDTQMAYGVSGNSLFTLDGRVNKKNKVVQNKTYAKRPGFECVGTSQQGYIAVGAEDGQVRLYDTLEKRAKTALPGLGDKVQHIDVSQDGKWILCTCINYIMVIPTTVPDTDRLGFHGRGMGKKKPRPYVLKLKHTDIQKYKLKNIKFTPAHFDMGKGCYEEHWVVTTTGPYIVKWNFRKLKKSGRVDVYSIRRANSNVVHSEFRYNHGDDLLVSENHSVYAQHSKLRKK